jgi:hypothetical protein
MSFSFYHERKEYINIKIFSFYLFERLIEGSPVFYGES